jgi:hypothetical protein
VPLFEPPEVEPDELVPDELVPDVPEPELDEPDERGVPRRPLRVERFLADVSLLELEP